MIVCDRETLLGTARGPPGTVGAVAISTGRGLGGAFNGLFCNLLAGGGLSAPARWFFVLAFRPNDEKKPGDFPEVGEAMVLAEDKEEAEVLVDAFDDKRDVGCARDG